MQLIDSYQRKFKYLRLSITEVCNFQCQYCLPEGYNAKRNISSFLSINEIQHVVDAFARLGVNKVRLTGGEPTLRKDFIPILETLSANKNISTVALTTNGYRVEKELKNWLNAGLTAINISVDSLSENVFQFITGQNRLRPILAGVDKALESELKQVKVNTVLMKGVNDNLQDYLSWIKPRRVELRFIELMETNDGSSIFNQYHTSGKIIEQQLIQMGWQLREKNVTAGPAKVYHHDDYVGQIGLILPYAQNFCDGCNRLRVSSSGKLHFCLFGNKGINLRDLLQTSEQASELQARILNGLIEKPVSHLLHEHQTGIIQNLSFIGG